VNDYFAIASVVQFDQKKALPLAKREMSVHNRHGFARSEQQLLAV
jgi:hypothetical protein